MATRNPLVLVSGKIQELPAGDTVTGAGSASWTSITASATTGTGTVACGSTPFNYCAVTTSGNITLNVTGSGLQTVKLRVTLGGTHTLAIQYAASGTSVKWPGGIAPTFITTSGSIFEIEGFADGSILVIENYFLR